LLFEWDANKRAITLSERGLDFASAWRFFDGRSTITISSPRALEQRWKTIAVIEGLFVTVVWTWRGEAVRIISMRRSHGDEERAYRALHG
jgi:uncharacterized DUF497 family protein